MRAKLDSQFFSNISATTALFTLTGGKYAVDVHASFGGGNIHLQKLLPDGSTLLDVGSSTNFTGDGTVAVDLGPGQYKFVITTATAVYAQIVRIPGE